MIFQVNTEVIAGEGMIVTAGAIDCHVHFICPQLAYEAISSGKFYNLYCIFRIPFENCQYMPLFLRFCRMLM